MKPRPRPFLGVLADDVTGACDLAGSIVAAGLSAAVILDPTASEPVPAVDVAVVALKSRTAPPSEAVRTTVLAGEWLLDRGATRIYQKYCSTFDSNDDGNIGPVGDGLVELLARRSGARTAVAVGTPATPAVGRTQYAGHLFVHGQLLAESPMREHPLTPMCESNLVRVLDRQTPHEVELISLETVREGPERTWDAITQAAARGVRHLLVDATGDADLDTLATALLDAPAPQPGSTDPIAVVMCGAAGLATALARRTISIRTAWEPQCPEPRATQAAADLPPVGAGARLILAGSCSPLTRSQMDQFVGHTLTIDARRAAADGQELTSEVLVRLGEWYREAPNDAVLIRSSIEPTELSEVHADLGRQVAAESVERTFAAIAVRAVRLLGVRRLIVAGGETSGAVMSALTVHMLRVGVEVSPGVPWTVSMEEPHLGVLLKSGNFGSIDLLNRAWDTAP